MSEQRKIVEDAPMMRSVAVMSATPQIPMARGFHSVKTMPRELVSTEASPRTKLAPKPVSPAWKVPALMAIPSYYPLERTNVTIMNATPQEVGTRLAMALQKESIAADFSEEEAKVSCETRCHVKLAVRLWKKDDAIVVETQRVSGCCFVFSECSRMLLRASKGMAAQSRPKRCMPRSLPVRSPAEEKEDVEEGLEIAENLLKSQQLDCQLLAVQSLVRLAKMPTGGAMAAELILKGECLPRLVSLIETSRTQPEGSELEKEHVALMHRNALMVLANCLTSLDEAGRLVDVVRQIEDLQSEVLLASLVDGLANSERLPHEACQCVLCLSKLVAASTQAKRRFADMGAASIVTAAQHAGSCRHAELEAASSKLLMMTGSETL